jgi:hypothetical protein
MPAKDEHTLAAEIEALKDDITFLTARAEVAEEDALDAWHTLVKVHAEFAKRGGDALFKENRTEYLAKLAAAGQRIAALSGQ